MFGQKFDTEGRKVYEFSDPQMDIAETTAQRVLMHSGVGSGKSHDMGIIAFDFCSKNPEVRGFIGANTYNQLSTSTLDRIFKVWLDIYGVKKNVHYVVDRQPPANFHVIGPPLRDYDGTISFNNGALIFINSLEKYQNIDGKEFGWALLDETKDTREKAVKEVIIARLRQLGMFRDSTGTIYKTLEYNEDTKEMKNLLEERLNSGEWVHDKEKNTFHTKEGRTLTGYTPLYIFTSPAKSKWLMEWFNLDDHAEEIEKTIYTPGDYYRRGDAERDQLVVISSTYHNEPNLSPGYIDRMIKDLDGDEGRISMMIYGSPFGKTGGEYYYGYKRTKHVQTFEPWDDEPIHLTFDFNSNPYMTCTCWQMKFVELTGRYMVRCFDEFCLESPNNNMPDLCQAIIDKYGDLLQKNGMFYYGDYSGQSENQTIQKDYAHHYEVVDAMFKGYGWQNISYRVIVNPRHSKRRPFINKCFNGGYPLDILIHIQCKEMRGDLEYVKQDGKNGGKMKTLIENEETGQQYQEHGHTSDSMDYFLCSVFNDLFNAAK